MSSINDGGPAFPTTWENDGDMNATAPDGQIVPPNGIVYLNGMTLRDYFAAKALQAFVVNGRYPEPAAREAYQYADAMLKERAQ